MSVFNVQNTAWKTGEYPLFLGQRPALHDTINVNYQELSTLALRQVSQRWVFDEINHEQSRLDLTTCPESVYKVMLMNIAYQWEADSSASRAIAVLLAPFVSNSEFWEALMENTNMEVTHAKAYSHIVRTCVPNPSDVFKMVMENEETLTRAKTVHEVFDTLAHVGARWTLQSTTLTKEKVIDALMMAMWALYGLERIQFMSSFAATFAIVEQGYFQSIGKIVQKIMLDELFCHAATDAAALRILLSTPEGQTWMNANRHRVKALLDDVVSAELEWAPYLLGEGRSIVGYTAPLASQWTMWNAAECYALAGVEPSHPIPEKNPLPWMSNYIDIDKTQNAQQEADGNNYALNVVQDDVGDEQLSF